MEQVCHFEDGRKVGLFAVANVGVGEAEAHTQLLGEPCLGRALLFSNVPQQVCYALPFFPLNDYLS